MRLEDLRPTPGAMKKRKRVGRGPGSGHGKPVEGDTKDRKPEEAERFTSGLRVDRRLCTEDSPREDSTT